MSKGARNRSEGRRTRRKLRRTPDAYFDLVQWLIDHGFAKSKRQARELILDKRVSADSHPLGVGKQTIIDPETLRLKEIDAVFEHVPVGFRGRVVVAEAE